MTEHSAAFEIKYTPYSELKAGDEFIKLGTRWVLLKDLAGTRELGFFKPEFTSSQYQIHLMVADEFGHLKMDWVREVPE